MMNLHRLFILSLPLLLVVKGPAPVGASNDTTPRNNSRRSDTTATDNSAIKQGNSNKFQTGRGLRGRLQRRASLRTQGSRKLGMNRIQDFNCDELGEDVDWTNYFGDHAGERFNDYDVECDEISEYGDNDPGDRSGSLWAQEYVDEKDFCMCPHQFSPSLYDLMEEEIEVSNSGKGVPTGIECLAPEDCAGNLDAFGTPEAVNAASEQGSLQYACRYWVTSGAVATWCDTEPAGGDNMEAAPTICPKMWSNGASPLTNACASNGFGP